MYLFNTVSKWPAQNGRCWGGGEAPDSWTEEVKKSAGGGRGDGEDRGGGGPDWRSACGTEATLLSAMKQKCLQITKKTRMVSLGVLIDVGRVLHSPCFLRWAIFYMFLSSHKC